MSGEWMDLEVPAAAQDAPAAPVAVAPLPAQLPPPTAAEVGAEQAATFLRLAAWLALLFAGYGFQRGLCAADLPYDCESKDAAEVYVTLTGLAFSGGALGWLAGVFTPARFAWLTSPRRAYLWLVYAATLPAYSALSNVPALMSSLSSGGVALSPGMIAVLALVGAALLAAVAFHFWLALREDCSSSSSSNRVSRITAWWRKRSRLVCSADDVAPAADAAPDLATQAAQPVAPAKAEAAPGCWCLAWSGLAGLPVSNADGGSTGAADRRAKPGRRRRLRWRRLGLYLLPRLGVLLYFTAWFAALTGSGSFELHLHHYALGWAVASLAAFNHPVSGLLLALGTAVFVQGAASYGLDPFFKPSARPPGGCLPVSSNATGQMTCAFWGSAQFDLRFCSNTPWIPWFDCTVPWPWPQSALASQASSANQAAMASGLVSRSAQHHYTPFTAAAPAPLLLPPVTELPAAL